MTTINWREQQVLLTGATGGLGAALAKALVAKGATVILLGRRQTPLEQLAKELQQPHYVVDINDCTQRQQLVAWLAEHHPQLTGLINNAAVTHEGRYADIKEQQLETLLTTNLLAPMMLTQQLYQRLSGNHGWIMNVGSVFGAIGFPGQVAYCASKFGLRGFSQALQRERHPNDVQVFYCAPRAIKTALNNGIIDKLNQQLKTTQDSPEWVAGEVIKQVEQGIQLKTLGWPEKLFVRINGLIPEMVGKSLLKTRDVFYRLIKESSL